MSLIRADRRAAEAYANLNRQADAEVLNNFAILADAERLLAAAMEPCQTPRICDVSEAFCQPCRLRTHLWAVCEIMERRP